MEEIEKLLTVELRLVAEQSEDELWPLACQVLVRDQVRPVRNFTIVIPKLLSDHQESELSWYLESYVQYDVFATKRAAVVEASIENYARNLSKLLTLDNDGDGWALGAVLNIIVSAPLSTSHALHRLHWEIIESTIYWPEPALPKAVAVVRQLACSPLSGFPEPGRTDGFTNILLVSARPQLDKDVPHRLASAMLWSVLEGLPQDTAAKVEITIERSGTFENFVALLKKFDPGHFDIVHFDLHGARTADGIALAFMKHGSDGISVDLIAGELIARVLGERKVRSVIMNACRSATSQSVVGSLAENIISAGVPVVIGQAFDAIASSMEQFVFTLYDAHLRRGLPLTAACHAARLMLNVHPSKVTRYGSTVDVFDAFVPVCYTEEITTIASQSLLENEKLAFISKDQIIGLAPIEDKIFGRENDLLLLEVNVLWSSKVAVLQGPAGIGKTALFAYASDWWRRTGVIQQIACVQLASVHQTSDTWPGLKQAVAQSLKFSSNASWDAVLYHLRSHPCCLCIDSLESLAFLNPKLRLSLRRDIKNLVKSLANSGTIVLATSRRDESWISPSAYVHTLRGINPTAVGQYIRAEAAALGLQIPYHDPEQLHYLEMITQLMDRNPLMIYAILREFHADDTDFRTFYYSLIAGKAVLRDVAWAETSIGFRSIVELSHLISRLDDVHLYSILLSNIGVNGESTASGQNVLTSMREQLSAYNLPDGCMPPFHLAHFWNKIPAEGLAQYIMFYNLELCGLTQFANVLASYPDVSIETNIHPPFVRFRQACTESADMVLLAMQKFGYISTYHENLTQTHTELYYKLHPLLTLLARSSETFKLVSNDLAKAFVKYQGYRLKVWPWQFEYGNPIWQPYLSQASLEFTNNLCAVVILFAIGYCTFWTHVVFKRVVLSIQKSLVNSLENQRIVLDVWRRIGNAMLSYPQEYFYRRDSDFQLLETTTIARLSGDVMDGEARKDFSLHLDHALFYERQYFASQIWSSLIAWQAHERTEEVEEDRKKIIRVLVGAERPTGSIKDLELGSIVRKLAQRAEGMIKVLEHIGFDAYNSGDSLDWWKDEGYKLLEADFELFHVEPVPHDRYTTPKGQRPWDKIPIHMNPTSAIIMSFVRVKETVEDLMDTKNFTKAREVISDALHSEINFRGDHAITKVNLLVLLARVEEMDGNWEDAFQRRREAEELEDSLLKRPSKMKLLTRNLKLARAAERLNRAGHLKTYVDKILKLANAAALAADLEIEVEAMKGLYQLDIANTLDGPISAVFLLIRGAKSQYRSNGLRKSPGFWFASLCELHAKHGLWWVLGPPDKRTKSILISNALRIFGLLVPQYGPPGAEGLILALITWFAGNGDDEKIEMLSLDLEERLFCAPDVEPECRLATANLNFSEQRSLFEFVHVQGIAYLRKTNNVENVVELEFPDAPYCATGPDGETLPPNFVFPTEMMLRLAGYIVD